MAPSMWLAGCLFFACVLSFASAQPLDESVFKQLTAAELRVLELQQNPALLDLAARTGERIVVNIEGPEQGAVVQDGVNAVLNCLPWLSRFPGGDIQWYRYLYTDLDHTMLGSRDAQNKADLNVPNSLRRIEGEFDEIFNITRVRIQMGAEDPHRGIYECEVCIARGHPLFEMCHSANVTLPIVGRAPILNSTTGRMPDAESDLGVNDIYRIGSTICITIDDDDHLRNRPLARVELRCPNVEAIPTENIPPDIPTPTRTWTHTSLDGTRTAIMASDQVRREPQLTDDFIAQFPLLQPVNAMNIFVVVTSGDQDTLFFETFNVTRNLSTRYEVLREAFGSWTCRLNNSLGEVEATTFISDMCGLGRPSIIRGNCVDVGILRQANLVEVIRGQAVPIFIGCDVCIQEAQEIWLTIECPTNVNAFPNTSVTFSWVDEDRNILQGVGSTLLVQRPGTYICIADFGNNERDEESTSVGFIPDVRLQFERDGSTNTGCYRLREQSQIQPIDVCAFDGEQINLACISFQENVTGTPIKETTRAQMIDFIARTADDDMRFVCDLESTNPDVQERCIPVEGGALNLRVYIPARITTTGFDDTCTAYAGGNYFSQNVSGAIFVALCCDADGFPAPTTTWHRVVVNPSTGIASEIQLIGGVTPNIMIDDENRLTISNYTAASDGTYVCRTSNIAGIDSGLVSITSTIAGTQWAMSPWSECDPLCLSGTRNRTVWCETAPEGVVIPDARCDCDNKPSTSETCTNVPDLDPCFMTPLWKTGEFSACSKGCAGGVRYRKVYCAIPFDGTQVDDLRCRERYGFMPPTYDICFNKCCKEDVYPGYCRSTGTGPCDNPVYQQFCCWTCGLTQFP